VSRGNRRFYRTLLLGIAALAALVWMAMDQFGISRGEIGQLFLGAVLAVGLVIGAAAAFMLLWVALRRLFFRTRD
jgi:K+-sensing histidine kinase KdpD